MRKVVLFIAASLDGFIARRDGGIDWLFTDGDYGYKNFYNSVDSVLVGRKTYDQALGFGEGNPFPGKNCFVFSRRDNLEFFENVTIIADQIAEFVLKLKHEPGKDIWLVGGAEINYILLESDLIDRFIISYHPVILGEGIPLFAGSSSIKKLKLEKSETFDSGLVQITWKE